MRVAIFAAVLFIGACASDGLSLAPPAGVDFSGHWKLNVADSDDPLHLLQIANAQADAAADNNASSGRGGRGGRGGTGYPGLTPPPTPAVGVLAEASRFPGKLLDVKQIGGVLTFSSLGQTRVCQPGEKSAAPSFQGLGSGRAVACGARRAAAKVRLARENLDRAQQRAGRRSPSVRRALQHFRGRPASDRGGDLQRRTLEWIHDVARVGPIAAIKKPGHLTRLLSPHASRGAFLISARR